MRELCLVTAVILLSASVTPARAEDAGPPAVPPAEPTGPVPIDPEDREALVILAETLPRHGVLTPKLPAPDAPDEAWAKLARRVLDVFAPASMGRDAKVKLLSETRPLAPAIADLIPRHRRYQALQTRLEAYALHATAAPAPIPETRYQLRVGTTAPEVALLRDRLLAEGYGDPNPSEKLQTFFDDRLKRALQAWQKDRGLPPTVVLDTLTRKRLNEPLAQPVADVVLALRRWRDLDLRLDKGRQLFVDMTRYELVAERDGVVELRMKVVVGKPTEADATPSRTAPLEAVIVNPSWAVPSRIVDESLRPASAGVPEVLMDKGYDVTVDPATGRWKVRMQPGPENPLGKLKFQLRGTNGVYLHDTPSRHVFGKAERTLSHGCVRLSEPEALARWLLPDRPFDLTNALALPTLTQSLALPEAVPVHFVYQTIEVAAGDARISRRADIYARDAEALAGIDAAAITQALRNLLQPR